MHRFRRIAMFGLVIGAVTATLALMTVVASSAPKANLLITPTGLSFGPVIAGTTSPSQTVTVTNEGSDPVTMDGTGGQLARPSTRRTTARATTIHARRVLPDDLHVLAGGARGFHRDGHGNLERRQVHGQAGRERCAPTFTISPTRIDFGGTLVGVTSPQQIVSVKNVGPTPATMAGTGISVTLRSPSRRTAPE